MLCLRHDGTRFKQMLLFHHILSSGDRPVPLVIGGDSSVTAKILSRVLGPLSVPLVSFIYLMFIKS